jgi:hypothetical protein
VDLPALQTDFEQIKKALITSDPSLEKALNEIGDSLDEVAPVPTRKS